MTLRFTLFGKPRTKKTSGQIVMVGKFPRIFPSKAFREWDKAAQPQLLFVRQRLLAPIDYPVNVQALFYREKASGDMVGFMQALADTLEGAGIVENDRWIVQWDGSRLMKDAGNPRVEVTITALEGVQQSLL